MHERHVQSLPPLLDSLSAARSADSLANVYTLFTFSARPVRLNSPATCINDCYRSEVSPPTETLNSGGWKLFGEEFTRGWGLVLQVTKKLQTACQSSLPTVPRGFSSAATPFSFKKAKSRKKASKKNFRAILDLLAGGAGTEASYINTHSQTPPGWRIIRPPPCHLPLNITAKKHRYLQEDTNPWRWICSRRPSALSRLYHLSARKRLMCTNKTFETDSYHGILHHALPGWWQSTHSPRSSCPQTPAVTARPDQYQKTSRRPRDYQSKQVDHTPLDPSVKVCKVKISSVTSL